MRPGRIVFLNGTSSAGKSSIAAELVELLDGSWFVMSVDTFHAMRSSRIYAGRELDDMLRRTRAGFHRAVAGMAHGGNNVIVDHVLSEPWRLDDCLQVFQGLDVVLIGVRCDLDELERREQARADRPTGLAAQLLQTVHAHRAYDFECDTTHSGPAECAGLIQEHLSRATLPRSFDLLRRRGAPVTAAPTAPPARPRQH